MRVAAAIDLAGRFAALDSLIAEYAWLWRPAPFRAARAPWCDRLPALGRRLLSLGETELDALETDDAALRSLLAEYLPAIAELGALTSLSSAKALGQLALPPRFDRDIPGRKREQIEAFARAVGMPRAKVLEWCAGKGHLGRLLATCHAVNVASVESNQILCDEGARLARRAGLAHQHFIADDVLRLDEAVLAARHVVALHACGPLHRHLVKLAVASPSPALDLSPCCYHLGIAERYLPFVSAARLRLGRDDLRLAVTDVVASSRRERSHSRRNRARKLAYLKLRERAVGIPRCAPLAPVPAAWLRLPIGSCCRRIALRDGVALPPGVDWQSLEDEGTRTCGEVDRLGLPRLVFRRAVEIWLALDCALALEAAGYEVSLAQFCAQSVTPRNLLISARLAAYAVRTS